MKKPIYYGLLSPLDVVRYAQAVCDVIGHGVNGNAVIMCVETWAAESLLGQYQDRHPEKLGVGGGQVDEETFKWLQGKYAGTPIDDKIYKAFGIRLGDLSYSSLPHSPLVCMIFTRLRYWVVTSPIPETREERDDYWKLHYNSSEGKGDPEHFIRQCRVAGVDGLLEQASGLRQQ